jgi:transposase
MRFYTGHHRFHCGVDLHAYTMYVCILDAAGEIVLERNVQTTPAVLLETIAPFRDGLVVACECLFTWYWLADLCAKEQISFVLGHALYMKAIHGGKAKNDRIDAHKIAVLLRGGMLPQAYVYPPGMRETRDLLRRRLHLLRKRGQCKPLRHRARARDPEPHVRQLACLEWTPPSLHRQEPLSTRRRCPSPEPANNGAPSSTS